jgi:hypothetical protein
MRVETVRPSAENIIKRVIAWEEEKAAHDSIRFGLSLSTGSKDSTQLKAARGYLSNWRDRRLID